MSVRTIATTACFIAGIAGLGVAAYFFVGVQATTASLNSPWSQVAMMDPRTAATVQGGLAELQMFVVAGLIVGIASIIGGIVLVATRPPTLQPLPAAVGDLPATTRAAVRSDPDARRPCPHCGGLIPAAATRCLHCMKKSEAAVS
jgi:hypothetical protein